MKPKKLQLKEHYFAAGKIIQIIEGQLQSI